MVAAALVVPVAHLVPCPASLGPAARLVRLIAGAAAMAVEAPGVGAVTIRAATGSLGRAATEERDASRAQRAAEGLEDRAARGRLGQVLGEGVEPVGIHGFLRSRGRTRGHAATPAKPLPAQTGVAHPVRRAEADQEGALPGGNAV